MYIILNNIILLIIVARCVIILLWYSTIVVIADGNGSTVTGSRRMYSEWVLVNITRRLTTDNFQRGGNFNFYFNAPF